MSQPMMTQLKGNFIPDQSGPGLTTTALSIDDLQGGSAKYATDDHNVNHNDKLKLAKNNFTTGTWNIRTMYCQGKLKELRYKMERYKWNVIGLAETRWTGAGKITTEAGHKLWYSGEENEHVKGVGFLIHKKNVKSVLECAPILCRIISIRLTAKPQNLSVIQVYAPTKASDEQTLGQFHRELEESIKLVPRKDILIVQGDWNARIGRDAYDMLKGMIGKFGLGHAKVEDKVY